MNVATFLKERAVPFEMRPHRREITAARTAQALHVRGARFAKSVVLKADRQPILALLQSSRRVNLANAARALGAPHVDLAPEKELTWMFPDCELGAVPPFGSQYGMQTVMDDRLAHDDEIIFEGNTLEQAVSLRYADFVAIEHPRIVHMTSGS